jgi:hypothetical protein
MRETSSRSPTRSPRASSTPRPIGPDLAQAADQPARLLRAEAALRPPTAGSQLSTIRAYHGSGNYYAPLVALHDAEAGRRFGFHGAIVLLTDPLRLHDAVENWSAAGIDVPTLRTTIISSDNQFGGLVSKLSRTVRTW